MTASQSSRSGRCGNFSRSECVMPKTTRHQIIEVVCYSAREASERFQLSSLLEFYLFAQELLGTHPHFGFQRFIDPFQSAFRIAPAANVCSQGARKLFRAQPGLMF